MMAVKRPAANSTETPSSARTSFSPRPYTLTASMTRAAGGDVWMRGGGDRVVSGGGWWMRESWHVM